MRTWKLLALGAVLVLTILHLGIVKRPGVRELSQVEAREDSPRKGINIAHRGARAVAPENTLAAARKAYRAGADLWEFDIRLTKDEKLVVIHDDTLLRTTNVEEVFPDRDTYYVDEFTLSEIKQLDAGSWFIESDPFGEINPGNVSSDDLADYRGEEVPTLREALELTKELNWGAIVELKGMKGASKQMSDSIVRSVVSLIEGLGLEKEVIVSSFDHRLVKKVKQYNSKIRGAVLVIWPLAEPVKYLHEHKVKSFNFMASAAETKQGTANIKEIDKAGPDYKVIVWTVNEPSDLQEFVENPFVDGISTDYPGRLSKILTGDI